ncbi:hypothetical protein [Photobacterium leiognathi]|uniref:hypothetical protein n=1 Tax=Photobacterium leiognathi TaxID=553611 RepID=UPI002982903E|nr:hypothetical protein [Photobacterium leiognathi]
MRIKLLAVLLLASGCSDNTTNIPSQKAAKAWLESTDECVYDVRDRNIKYQDSKNCYLSIIKMREYLNTYDRMINPDKEAEFLAMSAKQYHWMAIAISSNPDHALRLDVWNN